MAAATEVVIAACGVSDKYPKGKSAAMARGIEGERDGLERRPQDRSDVTVTRFARADVAGEETPSSFPAVGLRGVATWHLDEAAASALSQRYATCAV